ncbi:MAG: hypothetical protein ABWZ82_06715, partial [Candidatus Limnocylindrales bacterium]
MFERRLVTALVTVLLGLLPAGVAAQSPAPDGSPTAITLEPFEDAAYGLRSVAPAGWDGAGMGIRMRARAPGDQTLLALQSAPVAPEGLWPSLLPQLGLTSIPEPTGRRTTPAGLEWDLYRVPVGATIADLGLAAAPGVTYLALLVSAPGERDSLFDAVFLPAIDAL